MSDILAHTYFRPTFVMTAETRTSGLLLTDRFIEHTQYAPEYFLYPTLQQANDAMEVYELQQWLRRTVQWYTIRTFTLEQLRAVKEILDPQRGI